MEQFSNNYQNINLSNKDDVNTDPADNQAKTAKSYVKMKSVKKPKNENIAYEKMSNNCLPTNSVNSLNSPVNIIPVKNNLAFDQDELRILQLLQTSISPSTSSSTSLSASANNDKEIHERACRLRAIENETGIQSMSPFELNAVLTELDEVLNNPNWVSTNPNRLTMKNCPIQQSKNETIHSRADYIHFLVPDLKEITNSSFYWGKIDRYMAEKLLQSKPDGTFLLRDSAQDEHLFSVTFRKYGRSLHARIEESDHCFSFDNHDTGIYTSRTVTGLIEYYRGRMCTMFFEPVLTRALNRNYPFPLQHLCRATIVSNITYDGINELQLPSSLKKYLKAYHYKLCIKVKPLDE